VIDPKKIRKIVGYTQEAVSRNHDEWYKIATEFHEAAVVLYEHRNHFTRVFAFNAGLSIELLLKAILIAKGMDARRTHNIGELAKLAQIELNEDQRCTADLLAAVVEWRGRYPAPTSERKWDDFHDSILERHVIKKQCGTVFATSADPKRFPNFNTYSTLWLILETELRRLKPVLAAC
jgi:HEPN domain-containing protein